MGIPTSRIFLIAIYVYATDQYLLSHADNSPNVTGLFVDLVSILNFVELLTNSLVQGVNLWCCFFNNHAP